MSEKNPKLEGTNIIDCIPQTGKCPLDCLECFYNHEGFYRPKDEPLIPSVEESQGKIVRFNSGHDSNILRDLVIETSKRYQHFFFNTSLPRFDFPGPVVFTCNGREEFHHILDPNLMAVRIRLSTVNVQAALNTADFYISHGFPVLLTFMRYRDHINVPTPMDYEKRLSIKNEYYCIKPSAYLRLLKQFRGTGAKTCGTAVSNKCIDCRNCELFYWMWMAKSGRTLDEFEMAKRLYEAMRDEHQYYLESQGCGPTLLSSWEQIKENKREMNSLLAQARAAINYTRTATRT